MKNLKAILFMAVCVMASVAGVFAQKLPRQFAVHCIAYEVKDADYKQVLQQNRALVGKASVLGGNARAKHGVYGGFVVTNEAFQSDLTAALRGNLVEVTNKPFILVQDKTESSMSVGNDILSPAGKTVLSLGTSLKAGVEAIEDAAGNLVEVKLKYDYKSAEPVDSAATIEQLQIKEFGAKSGVNLKLNEINVISFYDETSRVTKYFAMKVGVVE